MPQLVTVPTPASGQSRVTFTSAEVGNGNSNDSGTQTNQDSGLAVRVQAEAADGTPTGPITRYTDEDIVFIAGESRNGTFDVRDLVSGVQRGDQFVTVQLGTQNDDVLPAFDATLATYINAGQGNDTVTGGQANDFLEGGTGNDTLNGGLGNDGILGGGGDDTARLNISTDGADTIDLGAGSDRVEVDRATAGQVRLSFTSAEVGNGSANDGGTLTNQDGGLAVRVQAEDGADGLTGPVSRTDDEGTTFVAGQGVTFDVRDLVSGVQRGDQFRTATLGTSGDDDIEGTAEADYINGGAGSDDLFGAAGNDFLVGATGDDFLEGGLGDDTILGGAGEDIVFANLSTDGADSVDLGGDSLDGVALTTTDPGQIRLTFTSAEVGNGAANDSGTLTNQDGGLAVRVQAEDAAGALTGSVSRYDDEGTVFVAEQGRTFDVRDLVSGVQRGDQFQIAYLGTSGDDAFSQPDLDIDTEDASPILSAATYVNGGQGNDTFTTANGNDFLVGGAGNDTLDGGAGNDSFIGGAGEDSVTGGAGDDTANLNVSTDGADAINLGDGNDRVAVTAAAASQVRLTFTSAEVGNGSPNDGGTLTNQDGGLAVRIQAEDGADGLTGPVSRADDEGTTFVAGNGVTFDVRDLVSGVQRGDQFRTATLGTSAGDTIDGTGEADYINAGGGDDIVRGLAGDDFLVGGAGDDTLDGGTGADGLLGGAGDDDYTVDDSADRVIEAVGGGSDTVFTSVSYRLDAGQEIERLELLVSTGTAALALNGNEFNQTLIGNDGDNTLDGRGGDDVLFGQGGNDIYGVDSENDQVVEAVGDGNDTIFARSSYRIATGQEIETLRLLGSTGTAPLVLNGNAFDQTLIGNNGNNTLDGSGGDDVLIGRGGDDIYGVDSASDQVVEAVGGGNDTIFARSSYSLAAGQEIETLRLLGSTGTADLDLTGNAFGQTLVANRGDNTLDGRGGADVLTGGRGADTFVFLTALGNGNVDRITDFSAADDTIELSETVFRALSAGELRADAFKDVGAGGTVDANDRIVYDSRSGALSYDADGSGKAAAVQFATLDNRPALRADDFLVV